MSSITASVAVAVSASTGGLPSARQRRGDLEVGRAEVVAPLRDAVRLVDDEEATGCARRASRNRGVDEPLGRGEDDARGAGGDAPSPRPRSRPRRRELLSCDGGDAELAQLVALVLHQRDQRRDDERGAGQVQRGQLVAQRLAGAGRHDRERRLARQHVLDHRCLALAQVPEAEGAAQQLREALSPGRGRRSIGSGATRRRRHGEGRGRHGQGQGGPAGQCARPRTPPWRARHDACPAHEPSLPCCPTTLILPSPCRRRHCRPRRRILAACHRRSTTRAGRSIRRRFASRPATRLRPSPFDDGAGSERAAPQVRSAPPAHLRLARERPGRRRHAARPGLGQRLRCPASGASASATASPTSAPTASACATRPSCSASARSRSRRRTRTSGSARARTATCRRPAATRAAASSTAITPSGASRGRRQVRAHARVRRRAAAHPEARRGRPGGAGRHAAAARDGAGDDRAPARHDLRPRRQRGVRAQQQARSA